jgi:subtilisin-like proprotein convertase family protein
VGGVAFIRSICAGNKGAGVSCVGNNVTRNAVQIVAHEVGHQLGANHTFHACGDNREDGNDFEPGGGSTIMSYADLCGNNSFVGGADPYYHNASLTEIYSNIRTSGATAQICANKINTQNSPPVITMMPPNNTYLPANTPFMLIGAAIDDNNDNLTYCWEQKDSTFSSTTLGSPSGNAPLFRSYPPRASSIRILPRESTLLINSKEVTEVLPSYSRVMRFSLTVRDNNKDAGIATWSTFAANVVNTDAPFKLRSQNTNFSTQVGSKIDLAWDVAQTDLPPINTKRVDIYLSKDGELDIRNPNVIPLSLGTPNDGKEEVIIPNVITDAARLIVKASDGIYFTVNEAYFKIEASSKPRSYFQFAAVNSVLCLPNSSTINLKSEALSGYNGKIKYDVINLPSGATASFSKNNINIGEATDLKIDFSNAITTGSYKIDIRGIGENADTLVRTVVYDLTSTDFADLALSSPVSGIKNATVLPEFKWKSSKNADEYEIQVSEDPAFMPSKLIFETTTKDTSTKPDKTLDLSKVYFWRVRAINGCKAGDWTPISAYGTEVLECKTFSSKDVPANISASGKPIIEAKVNIDADIKISDLNVDFIDLDHDNLRDITATITSPAGTPVVLFESMCPRKFALKASFDDEAPIFFNCSSDVQFKPQGMLSVFKTEPTRGQWTLKIEDKTAGNGGRLNAFNLEVCGNIPIENPIFEKFSTLQAAYKSTTLLTNNNLLSKVGTTPAQQLEYTITSLPKLGSILLSNTALKVGEKFTQLDIDQQKITYLNVSPSSLAANQSVLDSFGFVVINNAQFGWEGIKNLMINISTSPTDVDENSLEESIKIYPTPSTGILTVELPPSFSDKARFYIFSTNGKLMKEAIRSDNNVLDLTTIPTGQYILRIADINHSAVKSFSIIR